MKTNYLQDWNIATQNLSQEFIEKYFGKDSENYWIADEVGGVLYVNDHFFNLGDIVDFLRFHYSKNKMFEYYEYAMKCIDEKKPPINIKNYRHLKITS
jgi:hypothetical protein